VANPDIKPARTRARNHKDLTHNISALWLWCVPALIAIVGSLLYSKGILSLTLVGVVYTASVAWIGIGCFINGRICGRVHCKIDGIFFPLLSIFGILSVLGLIYLSWSLYWIVFFVILCSGFLIERLWK